MLEFPHAKMVQSFEHDVSVVSDVEGVVDTEVGRYHWDQVHYTSHRFILGSFVG